MRDFKSAQGKFHVEFEPAAFDPRGKSTDVTLYRHGHGNTSNMTLGEMRMFRDALTREIDRQADEAIAFTSDYNELTEQYLEE